MESRARIPLDNLPVLAINDGWWLLRRQAMDVMEWRRFPDSPPETWRSLILIKPDEDRRYYMGWNGKRPSGSDIKRLKKTHPETHAWVSEWLKGWQP